MGNGPGDPGILSCLRLSCLHCYRFGAPSCDAAMASCQEMSDAKSLSDLPSLGPKSQEMLARAGIKTVAQLRAMGSVAAYARVKKMEGRVEGPGEGQLKAKASLNLLWALESALSGEPWQQVARLHRTSLLLALDQYESSS
jgi:DNA transformation protein